MWQVETTYVKEITKPKAVWLKSVFRAVMFPQYPWDLCHLVNIRIIEVNFNDFQRIEVFFYHFYKGKGGG